MAKVTINGEEEKSMLFFHKNRLVGYWFLMPSEPYRSHQGKP